MISTTARAASISDLSDDEWHVVATRESIGDRDRWRYSIPGHEIKRLLEHRDHGEIETVQRHKDGVLLAKLARPVARRFR